MTALALVPEAAPEGELSVLVPWLKTQRQGRAALILRLANSAEPR
jgi:hypothetical protein